MSEKLPKGAVGAGLRGHRAAEVDELLVEIAKAIGGIDWEPVGGIANNVHTVEVFGRPGPGPHRAPDQRHPRPSRPNRPGAWRDGPDAACRPPELVRRPRPAA
jgi:hypothetical protein